MSGRSRAQSGYILVEATVALVILSIGALTIHRTIQEGIRTRGQAQDYTHARFLLAQILADLETQPELTEHSSRGQFPDGHSRFSWEYSVRRVDVPWPRRPLRPSPAGEERESPFALDQVESYLAHVWVTVSWTRGNLSFDESYETLLGPDKLWQPPPVRVP